MEETQRFAGTRAAALIEGLDAVYGGIDGEQAAWRLASPFQCPPGCGSCCVDFEPDVLEVEALYLAAWMIAHQGERAQAIERGEFVSPRPDPERGCVLFDPANPYHCTVYGGRCLICRLFAYTGDRGKDGRPRWKPCKHLPLEGADSGALRRPQYSEAELLDRFGTVPPMMSDIAQRVLALDPDGASSRRPLRDALPVAIRKIRLLISFSFDPPNPNAPAA